MTPRQADRIIKSGKPVEVCNDRWQETFVATFTHRDRWHIYGITTDTTDGHVGCWDRGELRITNHA